VNEPGPLTCETCGAEDPRTVEVTPATGKTEAHYLCERCLGDPELAAPEPKLEADER
jgi:hypothetical protein